MTDDINTDYIAGKRLRLQALALTQMDLDGEPGDTNPGRERRNAIHWRLKMIESPSPDNIRLMHKRSHESS